MQTDCKKHFHTIWITCVFLNINTQDSGCGVGAVNSQVAMQRVKSATTEIETRSRAVQFTYNSSVSIGQISNAFVSNSLSWLLLSGPRMPEMHTLQSFWRLPFLTSLQIRSNYAPYRFALSATSVHSADRYYMLTWTYQPPKRYNLRTASIVK
jgi:hypothetical protein